MQPIACFPIAHWYVFRGDWKRERERITVGEKREPDCDEDTEWDQHRFREVWMVQSESILDVISTVTTNTNLQMGGILDDVLLIHCDECIIQLIHIQILNNSQVNEILEDQLPQLHLLEHSLTAVISSTEYTNLNVLIGQERLSSLYDDIWSTESPSITRNIHRLLSLRRWDGNEFRDESTSEWKRDERERRMERTSWHSEHSSRSSCNLPLFQWADHSWRRGTGYCNKRNNVEGRIVKDSRGMNPREVNVSDIVYSTVEEQSENWLKREEHISLSFRHSKTHRFRTIRCDMREKSEILDETTRFSFGGIRWTQKTPLRGLERTRTGDLERRDTLILAKEWGAPFESSRTLNWYESSFQEQIHKRDEREPGKDPIL